MKKWILFSLIIMCNCLLIAQSNFRGVVFQDKNGNGNFDKNELGIPNVAVSNGTDVTITDKDGKYSLALCESCIIFVIKPSDYLIPLDQNNHHKFYHIHKPAGSLSTLKYKGSDPTKALSPSLDFGLIKATNASDKIRFIVFGDSQARNVKEMEYFDRIYSKEMKAESDFQFGITLGDIVWDDLSLYQDYLKVIKKFEKPWYALMGNHDMNFDVKDDVLSDETFEATFGPTTYAFNYGNAHFIVLDDVLYPDPRDGSGYWGGLRDDQFFFVENTLKHVPKDKLIVLFMHIPIFKEGAGFREEDRKKLLNLIAPFKNTLSFSAHTHFQTHAFFDKNDGFDNTTSHHHYNVGTTCGDWFSGRLDGDGLPDATMRDGTPKGYVVVNIAGSDYKCAYKVAGRDKNFQMNIYHPKVVKQKQGTTASIMVNFFNGAPQDSLKYRVNNGPWTKMQNMTAYDPGYLKELFNWDYSDKIIEGRRPSNPELTNHLWRANMPTNFEPGEHVIEIEAIDMYNQVFKSESKFRVEK